MFGSGPRWVLSGTSMTSFLQRLSVSIWAAARRGLRGLGRRVQSTPWLSDWVYAPVPERHPDADYRDYNGWYFGLLDQQERMLADGPRMSFYHAMISREVRKGDRVIDLGTGTGVLAAWSAHAGAAQVYALDHSAILDTAKRVAEANGLQQIEFVAVHSTDFAVPEKVDVIVHEQMGDYLFDEGMVANVCDLRDRMLKPGGRILPSRFEWFCEPVMLNENRRIPFVWEMNAHGYDYACLRSDRPDEPEYYRQSSGDLNVVERFLGDAAPALVVDLETMDPVAGLPGNLTIRREVKEAGQLDGLVIFFEVRSGDDLKLSSGPLDAGRAPHWAFRILRVDTRQVAAGDMIEVELGVGRWTDPDSWRWSVDIRPGVPA